METLVLCTCGHTLAQHDYDGCAGDRLRSCACRRDRDGALYSALDQATAHHGATRAYVRAAGTNAA